MEESGPCTALRLRVNGTDVVTLMYAIDDLDNVMRFGRRAIKEYERRLESTRKLDEISKKMISSLKFDEFLVKQVAHICREVDAGRMHQESHACPRIFFIVPTDKIKFSVIERATRFNLFTKDMQLYFVCRMFFEDLLKAAPTIRGEHALVAPARPTDVSYEYSTPLDIKEPRDFVRSRGSAIKLSLKVVQVLAHAAALGFGAGQLIPNLGLADHDTLFEILQKDFEAVAQEIEQSPSPPCDGNAPLSLAKSMVVLHNEGAHEALQGYLEKNHQWTWRSKVLDNLEMVPLESIGLKAQAFLPDDPRQFGYVCRENPSHRPF